MNGAIPFQMICRQCGDLMFHARIVPPFAGHPELASPVCESCKETTTRAEDEDEMGPNRASPKLAAISFCRMSRRSRNGKLRQFGKNVSADGRYNRASALARARRRYSFCANAVK